MKNTHKKILQHLFFKPLKCGKSRNGDKLKAGIGVLLCCKNEEYSIPYSLESLSSFASQIVCVDNGSDDNTLQEMHNFKNKCKKNIEIDIIDAKGLYLKDARNKGLEHIRYQWLLNCGGDFIFYTNGRFKAADLLQKAVQTNYYKAFRFGFVNLYGALDHTYKDVDPYLVGEHYLVKFDKNICFKEKEKFDYLHLPPYYLKDTLKGPLFFHMDGLKTDERILYRNCYFEWRQILNTESNPDRKKMLDDFEMFTKYWNEALYGTNDPLSLKYRFRRQFAELNLTKYDQKATYPYPSIVKQIIGQKKERYAVMYKDNRPYSRTDEEDEAMKTYSPSKEDLDWDVQKFEECYGKKEYLNIIKNKMINKPKHDIY